MGGFTYPYVMCFNSLEEEVELYGDTANFPPVGVADQTAWADVHASVSRCAVGRWLPAALGRSCKSL